jgi:polyether ionophore transport system permease protein
MSPADALAPRLAPRLGPERAIARRTFAAGRVPTVGFAWVFAVIAYVQPATYRSAYPKLSDRLAFAHSFGDNAAIRLFYGEPRDLLSTAGYSAWRVGGTLAILAGAWGLLAAVRALRAEEDAGRMDLVLAGIVGRRAAYHAAIAALAAGALVLWLADFAGLVAGGLPVGGSAYLALATASVIPVFAGIGAVTSQLAPTRRLASQLAVGMLALSFLLRAIADTSTGLGWLRWTTPLGWAEELRPFTGARPLVLLLPAAAGALLLLAAQRISAGRDLGRGVIAARDTAAPRLRLLSSPTAQALRSQAGTFAAWLSGVGAFALVIGVIAKSISSAGISPSLQREIAKLGSGSILTPTGYLGFAFVFFVLAVSFLAVAQVAAIRDAEASGQLETLLSRPVSRAAWLAGRLAVATIGVCAVSLVAGLFAWLGTSAVGISLPVTRLVEAGANCVPVALLFAGIAALGFACVPRAGAGLAYGLVAVAFVWDLFGALLGAPGWLVGFSPFEHVGLMPGEPFRPGAAAVMLAIAVVAAAAATYAFRRRDLVGA